MTKIQLFRAYHIENSLGKDARNAVSYRLAIDQQRWLVTTVDSGISKHGMPFLSRCYRTRIYWAGRVHTRKNDPSADFDGLSRFIRFQELTYVTVFHDARTSL